jgi:hypothetical protein
MRVRTGTVPKVSSAIPAAFLSLLSEHFLL